MCSVVLVGACWGFPNCGPFERLCVPLPLHHPFHCQVTNLEDNFVFYCSYHHNFINKLIHVLCVWPIVWTHIAMFTYATRLISLPVILPYQPSSLAWAATLSTLGWVTYWLVLDKKSGWLAAMLVVACLFSAQYFTESFGDRGYVIASWIHLACWIMQFVGHGIFEGRSPSLLDNLAQSFLMAPYFCFLEVCFWLGFRTDFREKTTPIILRRIREFDLKKSR